MAHAILEEMCTGCSACQRQCPAEAITGVFLEHYTIDAGTCIDCGLCGLICPEGAVLDAEGRTCERVARPDRLRPLVDLNTCNGCGTCVSVCPAQCRGIVGARRFVGHSALLFAGLCRSCGECERRCIKGAVKLEAADVFSAVRRAVQGS